MKNKNRRLFFLYLYFTRPKLIRAHQCTSGLVENDHKYATNIKRLLTCIHTFLTNTDSRIVK